MEIIAMSRKECNQIKVLEEIISGQITQIIAAKKLGITDRQVRNKIYRYKQGGPEEIVHKSRGRPSPKKWCQNEKDRAFSLLRNELKGFGPTLASEKLKEFEGIIISKETLRQEMIKESLLETKKRKPKYRSQRPRKLHFGEMTQLDGSPHDWFEGRGPKCTLLVFIDDATSALLWLEFATSESTRAAFGAAKAYIEKYGRPISLYVDYGSVWSVNTNNPDREKITQFERTVKELGVTIIHARSPQAKGRVERANKTLQDRLVKEMRLAGVSTIEAANAFVQKVYIPKHNAKFAIEALSKENVHRSIEDFDMEKIFCMKEERLLQNDFTIRYKNRVFQLHKDQRTIIRPKNHITVSENLTGVITLSIRQTDLSFNEITDLKKLLVSEEQTLKYWQLPLTDFLRINKINKATNLKGVTM